MTGVVPEPPEVLSEEEERSARGALRYVLWFGLAVLVLASIAVAVVTQVGHLPDISWHFSPGWLVASVAIFALVQLIGTETWRLIVVALHGHVDPARARAIWCTSNLARYVPTSLLLLVTRVAMAERAGIKRTVTAASLVYELALTTASALAVGAYGIVQLHQLRGQPARWLVIAVPLVAVAALHPRVFRRVGDMLLTRLGRGTLPETLSFPRVLSIAGLYAAGCVVAGFGTYCFARSLHPVANGDIPIVVASFGLALSLSYLGFILPAGLGAREAGFTAALSLALPTAVALAVAVGVRLVQMAIEVIYALVTPWWARRSDGINAERRSGSGPAPRPPAPRRAR
jgi:hypothetical protein